MANDRDTGLDVRVFVSYRRRDDDPRADRPGQVAMFTKQLEGALRARTALSRNSWVYFDKDPKEMLTSEAWYQKIRNKLHDTTVLVSIMTANYLAVDDPNAACRWEFGEYSSLLDREGSSGRTLITLRLCQDSVARQALNDEEWRFLTTQEIIGYEECRLAWDLGPSSSEWGSLLGKVADCIIGFAEATSATKATDEPSRAVPLRERVGAQSGATPNPGMIPLQYRSPSLDSPSASELPLKSFSVASHVRSLLRQSDENAALTQIVTEWLSTSSSHLAIVGNPGSGKSTAAAAIYSSFKERAAVHFCSYANDKTTDSRLILQSLAGQVASVYSDYRTQLQVSVDFERDVNTLSAEDLFDLLFLQPFDSLDPQQPILLVIDAIDECPEAARATLTHIILTRFSELSHALRIVITSRKDSELVPTLYAVGANVIDSFESTNRTAMELFIADSLLRANISYDQQSVTKIAVQSRGDFLYAKFIIEELRIKRTNDVSKVIFPIGMKGVCQNYFDRIFGDDSDYYEETAAPFLEVISVAGSPLPIGVLESILNFEPQKLRKVVRKLDIFLDIRDDTITFAHKSIYDWLRSISISDKYYISLARGLSRLCDYVASDLCAPSTMSSYTMDFGLRRLAEARRYETISMVMLNSESQVLRSLFLRFLTQMVLAKDEESIVPLFAHYCAAGGAVNGLVSEAMKTMLQYEHDDVAEAIAGCFPQKQDKEFATLLLAFHRERIQNHDTGQIIVSGEAVLDVASDWEIRLTIMSVLADAHREKGEHALAAELYEECVDRGGALGLTMVVRDSRGALIDLEYVRGALRTARESLDRFKRTVDFSTSNVGAYEYYRLLGDIFRITGSTREARAAFEKCLEIANDLSFLLKKIETNNSLAEVQDSPEAGLAYVQVARDLTREGDFNRLELGKGYYIEGELYLSIGQATQAQLVAQQSLEILEQVGYASGCARAVMVLGRAQLDLGEFTDAIPWFIRAVRYYSRERIYPSLRANAYIGLLTCAKSAGRLDEYLASDDLAYVDLDEFPEMERYVQQFRKLVDGEN